MKGGDTVLLGNLWSKGEDTALPSGSSSLRDTQIFLESIVDPQVQTEYISPEGRVAEEP